MTHHILVVDDEPDIEALVTQKFRREISQGKYRFTFTQNGAEAYYQVTETHDIDMVLTDINMPVMDGLTLLNKLNKLEQPPKTVVVSAYSDMNNIRVAMNSGAFDFLTKPINLQDLFMTLTKTLQVVAETKANQARLEEAQLQMIQSEKLSSLGQMVAGIAHEINNPVSFIYGNIKPTLEYVQDLISLIEHYQQVYPQPLLEIREHIEAIDLEFLNEDLPKLLNSLELGTNRIRDLVVSLRNFSRLDEAAIKGVDIHAGIDSTLTILNHRLKAVPERPAIEIEKVYGVLPKIECYPSQLNQVFMNILANAIDALEEHSQDRSFEEIEANPNTIQIRTDVVDNNWANIVITDNGPGIGEETIANLFDPFFTTKPIGKGTGLGLAISYQIIADKHGGRLSCDSTPGKGTKFVIELPIS